MTNTPVITSPTAGTQNTAISTISGTSGEAGLTIEVFNGATSLGTTTSTAGGAWTKTLGTALGEGSYSFTAKVTDAATNTSPASTAVNVVVDTHTPTVTANPTSTPFGPLGLDVELNSDDTDFASIFYTTDGTDPDTSATRTHTQVLYILQQLPQSSS